MVRDWRIPWLGQVVWRVISVPVCLLAFGLLWGMAPSMGDEVLGDRPARAALIALRSTLSGGEDALPRAYLIWPSPRPVAEDAVLEGLKNLAKPVSCSAQLRNGLIDVRCEDLREPHLVALHAHHAAVIDEWLASELPADCRHRGDSVLVALRGAGEFVVLPLSDLKAFFRDYLVLHSLSTQSTDPIEEAQGACATFRIRPPLIGDFQLSTP